MSSWQELTEYNNLWVIDRDSQDAWFAYFDNLMQFELSRNIRRFQDSKEPWIFSGAKYVPATLIFLADFSDAAVTEQQNIWKGLGSPKSLIYSADKTSFVKKFTSVSPESFHHIKEAP